MNNEPKSSEYEPRKTRTLEFQEHHGIETDMTGLRVWYCDFEDKNYAIWEITYESSDMPEAILPYYRLNWRVDDSENDPWQYEPWQLLKDCGDFAEAVGVAGEHAGIE